MNADRWLTSHVDTTPLDATALLPATNIHVDFIESTFIPELSTALLVGLGLIGLGTRRRKA